MGFYKILLFGILHFINNVQSFNLCVVGASSGLGRELVYQSLQENNKVLALTTKNSILVPYRGDSFQDKGNNISEKIINENLLIQNYWEHITSDYENIIFCTSAGPFEKDYSDILTEKFLCHLSPKCKTISLISAYGVGDSLNNSNLGIKVMDSLYLKDVYRAKNRQEKLIANFNSDIKKFIYRPKALSYGKTILKSTSRKEFVETILNKLI